MSGYYPIEVDPHLANFRQEFPDPAERLHYLELFYLGWMRGVAEQVKASDAERAKWVTIKPYQMKETP